MTNLQANPVVYYTSNNDLNSDKIILNMINELLRSKYQGITFYCHNLGGFDIVYILKALYKYNDASNLTTDDKYSISCVLRDDKIIKVTISKGNNYKVHQFIYLLLFQLLDRILIIYS